MCQDSLHDLLKSLPKCEHHMHLEGALTPKLLFQLASKNKIQLPADDKAFTSTETLLERYNHFTSLDDCKFRAASHGWTHLTLHS